jgi:predicted NAD/FAD-dependent oxidoreductase
LPPEEIGSIMTIRIAIIGAGIAGLSLASRLRDRAEVTVFEKSRGVSGRMSTRYADPFQFDHGAQYFTARNVSFQAFLAPFLADGTVQAWSPKVITLARGETPYKRDWFEPHYVAAPRMNRLCQRLAEGLDVRVGVEIRPLSPRSTEGWWLRDATDGTHGPYDWVISTAPAAQTATLLPPEFSCHEQVRAVRMEGCYSLLVGMAEPLPVAWDVAVVKDSPLAWIAANHSKPGREATAPSLLAQSTPDWAEAHINEDVPAMQALLLAEMQAVTGLDLSAPAHLATHRWRYASVAAPAGEPFLLDEQRQLAACGDWCLAGRVESAWVSADALAIALLAQL